MTFYRQDDHETGELNERTVEVRIKTEAVDDLVEAAEEEAKPPSTTALPPLSAPPPPIAGKKRKPLPGLLKINDGTAIGNRWIYYR